MPLSSTTSLLLAQTPSARSTASDWSDPRGDDDAESITSGVEIPALLRSLFDLDFLPLESSQKTPAATDRRLGLGIVDVSLEKCSPASPRDDYLVETGRLVHVIEPSTPMAMVGLVQDAKNEELKLLSQNRHRRKASWKVWKSRRPSSCSDIQTSLSSLETTPQRRGRSHTRSSSEQTLRQEYDRLAEKHEQLESLQRRCRAVRERAATLESNIDRVNKEASKLSAALAKALDQLEQDSQALVAVNAELDQLETQALVVTSSISVSGTVSTLASTPASSNGLKPQRWRLRRRASTEDNGRGVPKSPPLITGPQRSQSSSTVTLDAANLPPPVRARANTDPRTYRRCSSASFMRVSDLDRVSQHSLSDLPSTGSSTSDFFDNNVGDGFFLIDENLTLLLAKLNQLGYEVVTDESDRFSPIKDTARILKNAPAPNVPLDDWPVCPWYRVADDSDDVLAWVGGVDHKGFGHDWPVVKVRGIVRTTPRQLVDFLLDSSQIKLYNKMSVSREDTHIIQASVDTTEEESEYGFAGAAKIMRALNKPKLLPMTLELVSLWNARRLEQAPGSYMIVNRSVWEDSSDMPKPCSDNVVRTEMLLGVQLVRPCNGGRHCELTTITHVYPQGVPEAMAKRMAPSTAIIMVKDLQAIFHH